MIRAGLLKLGGGMLEQLLAADPGHRGPRVPRGNGHEAEFISCRDSDLGSCAARLPWPAGCGSGRMNAAEYVVPAVLRGAMFVPRQAAGRREPARVTPGAFRAAGLPVPGHPAQRNVYQLTRRQGLPWTPGLDGRIRRRGGELLGRGKLILVDIDTPAAVDGIPMLDALRWLGDAAVVAGGLLDLSATVSVRTPGHPGRGHLPGWHLWYRADPGRPVRMGPLARCHAAGLRARGTCPGSPGYVVWSAPGQLPVLPS